MNLLGPRNGGESDRRTAFECCPATTPSRTVTAANDGVLPRAKLGPASLAPSSPALLMCALQRATVCSDCAHKPLKRERKRERRKDYRREGESLGGQERERDDTEEKGERW